jgi:FHA domain
VLEGLRQRPKPLTVSEVLAWLLDRPLGLRDTAAVVAPGSSRQRLAGILSAAFAEGLLSEQTLSHRLGLVFGPRLVDPDRITGDLALRTRRNGSWWTALGSMAAQFYRDATLMIRPDRSAPAPLLLTLDPGPQEDELLIGRASDCDVLLEDRSVSRRHARLIFRDSQWVINDLGSTNGTVVNGVRVGRCQLRAGDHLLLGSQPIHID